MSERIVNPNTLPKPFFDLSSPEKFGEHKEIVDLLENGKIINFVNIDDVRPELKNKHQNEVDLVDIGISEKNDYYSRSHLNTVYEVELDSEKGIVRGIFKPAKGENNEIKKTLNIHNCYLREIAAYQMDRILGFGIVPPTSIREINGEIGSIQLYIPPEIADNHGNVVDKIDFEIEQNSHDWMLMAIFDYITANWERKPDNWLVDWHTNSDLYAIDHGYAFFSQSVDSFEKRGPRRNLTFDNAKEKPIVTPLPDFILKRLHEIKETRVEEIKSTLNSLVPNHEIDQVLKRIDNLIEAKIFL
ncbi:hypothetical protein COT76_02520 [Candidatus Berkelbacteria bacterium CG10_big_fil_rev_8_21_14_0_10_33_10]|nr:MAG: hypothetical protein COT76_02520 [Candidatus Berkelbacteria bacterium CG10_big_fil_rev_8_21_14_0_10_33_10]